MDLFEKSMPVKFAPSFAKRPAYKPGPHPKRAVLVSLPILNSDAIHSTERSINSAFREEMSMASLKTADLLLPQPQAVLFGVIAS